MTQTQRDADSHELDLQRAMFEGALIAALQMHDERRMTPAEALKLIADEWEKFGKKQAAFMAARKAGL